MKRTEVKSWVMLLEVGRTLRKGRAAEEGRRLVKGLESGDFEWGIHQVAPQSGGWRERQMKMRQRGFVAFQG
eukprot:CAMPEP_0201520190 /NCGR_PEP_ID=MMETSP0161_2-20130828/10551_1 /ASSEMBLY_ACC=CAM_ASM_000251 /TAXON_ID=180227 /ORGANISM="Neoparamoeba aestuarina, Strain SoJaBio B1-5/56/2" /LENGTH=71 /DNA_ID=CAMNT_0047918477 /DNA_START=135 /DNA_END=350 /DNA_ORIENTATION=-